MGTISRAAKSADISRESHYEWIEQDPEYATAFEQAKQRVADLMEEEADRRARKGLKRLKFHQGVAIIDPRTGKPYVEHEYSDTLMIFLLKGLKPDKYRERPPEERKDPTRTISVPFLPPEPAP